MKRKHLIWMLVGCTVPLLLIFLAPVVGLSENLSPLLFVLVMFACHLFMPFGYGKHQQNHLSTKTTQNEQHQY